MSGSATPRYAVLATDRPSHGPALADVAASLGVQLLPWQRQVADVALEHDPGTQRLSYRDVCVAVPRQSGKTTLTLAVVVHRMLSAPRQHVAYSAQTRLAARSKLFEEWYPRISRSPLSGLFTLSRATGAETLRCRNGSLLTLLSADESAGHGDTLDLAILDECWALSAAAEQSVRPAMITRRNAQLWLLSTAGTDKSVYWRGKIDAGRLAATTGMTESMAFFEWSAAPGMDPGAVETWQTCMPALGFTVDPDTIRADMASMSPGDFARAYLNLWGDESFEGWKVIEKSLWDAARW